MSNTILTPTIITKEALRVLHQKLNFIGSIERQYDDSFANEGAKIGSTLKIRKPNKYTYRTGATMQVQDTTESTVDLTVASQGGVDMNFSTFDLTMSIDRFSERYIEPAMAVVAANVEADALTQAKNATWQQVNNQGSAATFAKALSGRKMLSDSLAPVDNRFVCMNTQDNADLVDALKGLFQDSKNVSMQNKEGYLGRTAGFDWTENTLIPSHTRGGANTSYTTDTTTSAMPLVSTNLTSITVASGSGGGKKGDVFTIDKVYRVHPETKVSAGVLHQFVVAADFSSTTVTFLPGIILAGADQNCTIPTTSSTAAISWAGTASTAHGISLAYHKEAFAFATADLIMPKGVDFAAREVYDGISLRIVRQYDINNDKMPCRIDIVYGFSAIRPQLAARLANN